MNKSIELTRSQIKALKNGATMLIFPIGQQFQYILNSDIINNLEKLNYFTNNISRLQKGDKDVILIGTQTSFINWTPKKAEVLDVRVLKVKDIPIEDIPKIQTEMFEFDKWHGMKDNDYVFLCEVKVK